MKAELKAKQNKILKTQIYKWIKSLQRIANGNHNLAWKSKWFSDESMKPLAVSKNSLAPALNHFHTKLQVRFDSHC